MAGEPMGIAVDRSIFSHIVGASVLAWRAVIFVAVVALALLGFAHSASAKENYFDMGLEELMR